MARKKLETNSEFSVIVESGDSESQEQTRIGYPVVLARSDYYIIYKGGLGGNQIVHAPNKYKKGDIVYLD